MHPSAARDADSAVRIDGSDSALRLEPIRPSGVGLGLNTHSSHHHGTMASPPLHHAASGVYRDTTYSRDTALGASMILGEMPAPPPSRPRARTSADEIRALLQRTNNALDKIVKIRESMEPFVDFKQFEKRPGRRGSTTLSRTSSGLEDAPVAADAGIHPRGHSYGSTISEDPVGDRSTGSTESTSSTEDMTSASELGSSRGETELVSSSRSGLGAALADEQHREQQRRDGELSDIDDDDDDDSTFSGGDELPPLKEARLERLKNITIAFHDGLPTEFFMALTRFLYTSVEVKTRHSRFSFFKDTFVGSDAVRDMVLTGFAEDQNMALRFGHILVKLGYIEHVSRTDDQLHNNKDNFYRFTKAIDHESADQFAQPGGQRRTSINANNYRESVLSRESSASVEYDFGEATCEVHALVTDETLAILARVLHKVFERKNKLLFYKGFSGCFLGAEAVNVIRELRIGTSLVDAVLIGQALLDEKIIEPIATTVTTFQDRYVFYRLSRVPS